MKTFDYKSKQLVAHGCGVTGMVVVSLNEEMKGRVLFPMGLPIMPLIGAVLGLTIGSIIALCLPKRTTTCPLCGSNKALVADRSFITGRELPNRCRVCGHSWQGI